MSTPQLYPMKSQHYNLLAASIAEVNRRTSTAHQAKKLSTQETGGTFAGIAATAIQLAKDLKEDNPRVDVERFLRACAFPHYMLDTVLKASGVKA